MHILIGWFGSGSFSFLGFGFLLFMTALYLRWDPEKNILNWLVVLSMMIFFITSEIGVSFTSTDEGIGFALMVIGGIAFMLGTGRLIRGISSFIAESKKARLEEDRSHTDPVTPPENPLDALEEQDEPWHLNVSTEDAALYESGSAAGSTGNLTAPDGAEGIPGTGDPAGMYGPEGTYIPENLIPEDLTEEELLERLAELVDSGIHTDID